MNPDMWAADPVGMGLAGYRCVGGQVHTAAGLAAGNGSYVFSHLSSCTVTDGCMCAPALTGSGTMTCGSTPPATRSAPPVVLPGPTWTGSSGYTGQGSNRGARSLGVCQNAWQVLPGHPLVCLPLLAPAAGTTLLALPPSATAKAQMAPQHHPNLMARGQVPRWLRGPHGPGCSHTTTPPSSLTSVTARLQHTGEAARFAAAELPPEC
jgi:hypothetical protein